MNVFEDLASIQQAFHQRNDLLKTNLEATSKKVEAAIAMVKESWSNSYFGWHASMYFLDYQLPTFSERFSPEWGGINGVPSGWYQRQSEDVKKKIEELAGDSISFDELEKNIQVLKTELEDLKDDVLVEISVVPSTSMTDSEQELLMALKTMPLFEDRFSIMNRGMPNEAISRDSDAVMEGTRIPAWLEFLGTALEARSICLGTDTFLRVTERLTRQMERRNMKKTDSTDLHPAISEKCFQLYMDEHYSEAVGKSFLVVRDRLRELTTRYETGSDAFGKGHLYISGASAPNVDKDFNQGVKFLTMAIDCFRNEKFHTSDGNINDPVRAYQYLAMSSLAMSFLDNTEIRNMS